MIKLSIMRTNILQTYSLIARSMKINRGIFTSTSVFNSEDNESDSAQNNSESEKADKSEKKKEVEKKLKDLLLMMSKISSDPMPNVRIPKPRESGKAKYEARKAEILKDLERREQEKLGYRLEKAAEEVAESLGGDPKKTEAELLDLYLFGKTSEQAEKTESKEKTNLGDLLTTMKVEKETGPSRADQIRAYRDQRPEIQRVRRMPTGSIATESVNIFGEIPFGFFSTENEKKTRTVLSTWDYLNERDLRLCVTHPPGNIFEQLIQWTNEGKIWRFPIDNEQDWPEEPDIDFTEHVFLERHIEPWCPKSGPIRHFMELVCTGLSKNPYMTVAEKRAHISFYENYFRSKNALLAQLGIPEIPEKSEQIAVE